jgi:hypothetical protein
LPPRPRSKPSGSVAGAAFGRARLPHEGEGLRDDECEILAEQSVHLTGAGERGIFPDAENPQPAARIMGADLDRLASEDHPLAVECGSKMASDQRHLGLGAHHDLLEHFERPGE